MFNSKMGKASSLNIDHPRATERLRRAHASADCLPSKVRYRPVSESDVGSFDQYLPAEADSNTPEFRVPKVLFNSSA